MKQLQLSDQEARSLYPSSTKELKKILEATWGKEFFQKSVKDLIKTWQNVVNLLGEEACELPWKNAKNSDQRATNAFHKLTIIIRLLKNGEKLDYSNTNQPKYWAWFRWVKSGFAFGDAGTVYDSTDADVGPRLSSKTDTDARWVAENYPDLYNDLYDESDI